MAGENRIAEMIQEMEKTFAERDALYKDRDEAYSLQFQSLKEREDLLEREDSDRKQTAESLKVLEDTLKKKEEELAARESVLREKTEAFEKECRETGDRLREEQVRLNLREARLQNEQVRQQTAWLRYEGRMKELDRTGQGLREGTVYTDKETVIPEIRKLRQENEELRKTADLLRAGKDEDALAMEALMKEKDQLLKNMKIIQEEKQELFKKLLASDEILGDPDEQEEDKEEMQKGPGRAISEEDPGETGPQRSGTGEPHDRKEDFLEIFRNQYTEEDVEPFSEEDGREGICVRKPDFTSCVFFGKEPALEVRVPAEDSLRLRKTIRRLNGDGGMKYRYDRSGREVVITAPFGEEDEADDVLNLLRCILDYEVPSLRRKGGNE